MGATTVKSSGPTSTRRTTAATDPRMSLSERNRPLFLELLWSLQQVPSLMAGNVKIFHPHHQVRDAEVVTMTARDAVPQTIPAMRVRETVTDLETEVSMMAMPAARVTWCAARTTVSSLELTTTRRTTAVRSHHLQSLFPSLRSPKERSSKVRIFCNWSYILLMV